MGADSDASSRTSPPAKAPPTLRGGPSPWVPAAEGRSEGRGRREHVTAFPGARSRALSRTLLSSRHHEPHPVRAAHRPGVLTAPPGTARHTCPEPQVRGGRCAVRRRCPGSPGPPGRHLPRTAGAGDGPPCPPLRGEAHPLHDPTLAERGDEALGGRGRLRRRAVDDQLRIETRGEVVQRSSSPLRACGSRSERSSRRRKLRWTGRAKQPGDHRRGAQLKGDVANVRPAGVAQWAGPETRGSTCTGSAGPPYRKASSASSASEAHPVPDPGRLGWRRGWDLNPRSLSAHALSRRAR